MIPLTKIVLFLILLLLYATFYFNFDFGFKYSLINSTYCLLITLHFLNFKMMQSLLNLDKRLYITSNVFNFSIIKEDIGFEFSDDNDIDNYFIFCLDGKIQISYEEDNKIIETGQVIFISRNLNWKGVIVHDNTRVFIHSFNIEAYKYDKSILHTLLEVKSRSITKFSDTNSLPINDIFKFYIDSIYIHLFNKIENFFFWSLKHQEIIHLFTLYYPKESISLFLQTLLMDFISFKSLVILHSPKAKNCLELAQLCGYELNSFSILFKKEFNQTVYQWLQERKAERVKKLIATPHIPLKNIMYDLNFTSASHLTKFCKKYFGATPSQLREKLVLENNV